jgi:chemotaxis protein CheZ
LDLSGPVKHLFSAERKMMELRGEVVPETVPTVTATASSTDLSQLLAEIRELKGLMSGGPAKPVSESELPEISVLREHLVDLRNHIDDTKKEIASIRQPGQEDDRLTSAAMELDAIVAVTEQATNQILNSSEEIGDLLDKLKERSDDLGAHAMIDEAMGKTINIMEACNFQDLSGQRTTKVVKTIQYLEERILSMIDIWGEDGFKGIEVDKQALEGDAALLNGPQHEDAAIDQSDIDALFD